MSDSTPVIKPLHPPANILVCDDDEDTRFIIGQTLLAAGYQVVETADGSEAVESCKAHLPDLIVMDVMMPGMTGTEFVQWFRAEVRDSFVPVLMVTALGEVEHKIEGLEIGADDYMSKPFHNKELKARVEALLRTRALTEELRARSRELELANKKLSDMQAELLNKERELAVAQVAGAAAHNLRQPVTAVMLHCHVIKTELEAELKSLEKASESMGALSGIRRECQYMNAVLEKMVTASANSTESYLEGIEILDLGLEPQSAKKTDGSK